MKGLKKLAIATAVAAAPFAQAEMTALDDSMLAEMTGQAGVTLDINLQMDIDVIKYVDSDGGDNGKGAVTVRGIHMGNVDDLDAAIGAYQAGTAPIFADTDQAFLRGITIDADGDDGLVIGLNQIGGSTDGTQANNHGIDIVVDAVMFNNGFADKSILEGAAAVSAELASGTPFGGDPAGWYEANIVADPALAAAFATAVGLGDTTAATDAVKAAAGRGNIGGFIIEDFRNYLEDEIVTTYDDRFDMALGFVPGNYVKGEIQVVGTGNALQGTSGISITTKMGGIMDRLAWVDDGGQMGVKDLGFFKGGDNIDAAAGGAGQDGISDTVEALEFNVDIDVVEHTSWNGVAANDVAALQLSNMHVDGTIMMGNIYLAKNDGTGETSLGSVLIKDIDMSGTEVFIYGH